MIKFDSFQLSNGLKVIVNHDNTTPIVAMNIIYKVGSRDESIRRTGFAHLFEHLMFGGSENIPSYDSPLQYAGGENNAFTNSDFTNYYLTIPKNNLETAFWLESDRMNKLAFSKKSLNVQKNVVIEEFKQNYLNQPYGDVYLLLKPLAYKKHPYRWITIGRTIKHIEDASLDYVKSFYRKYYNPSNAILSISGNVTTSEIERLSNKWFGPIIAGETLENIYPQEPDQISSRSKKVTRNVPQNAIYLAWHMPDRTDPEYYNCDLVSDILSNGKSSRLYQNLVKDRSLFSDINAFITGDKDKGLFIISAKLLDGITSKEASVEINKELINISSNKITDNELIKVKNKIEANTLFAQSSILSKAMNLGYFEFIGDVNMINDELDMYESITKESIMETAKNLFTPERLNMLIYNKLDK